MARFIYGINHCIAHIVELYHYIELEEMMQYSREGGETT
jgi:hypothetical protein